MKNAILLFLVSMILMTTTSAATLDYVIKIEAEVQASPASIKLIWETPSTSAPFKIFRKLKGTNSWGNQLVQLPSTATSYTDNTVSVGTHYEYFIYKDGGVQPYGYISAAIEDPAIHNRGALLLLVDDMFTTPCSAEINTLMKDLSADGWEVIRKDFPRTATVATVKSFIQSTAQANAKLQGLYILGHIAVPYSGNIYPDGHTVINSPNNPHEGAWPADVYYSDIDGTWTDNSVNIITSGNPLNHNTPGDGKFDQDNLPSDAELQMGRVDFFDMPAFSNTEVQLMKSYLNKAHQYKIGALTVIKRALIDDNFNSSQEAFAGNGWRNFSCMVGIDSVSEKDFVPTLNSDFYQWAYGCGAGSYTSCSGVGNTNSFKTNDVKSIFTSVFGSYFGDWNYKNNFLRAPLCANEPSLATFWAARPNWFLHHMALGENIGYSTRLTQNNVTNQYATPIPQFGRIVSTALMGDPSLRTDYMQPVPSITLSTSKDAGAIINWTASPEAGVEGYFVYRATSEFGEYKIRSLLVNGTSFIDSFGTDTTYWYMVRASKLQMTPSGSYHNLSLGTAQSGTFKYPYIDVSVNDITAFNDIKLYPNPSDDMVTVELTNKGDNEANISISNIMGQVVFTKNSVLSSGRNNIQLNVSSLPSGTYIVHIRTDHKQSTLKFIKN